MLIPTVSVEGFPSVSSAGYIYPGALNPVFLFRESMPEHRGTVPGAGGLGILGETQFDDPGLIGVWVTPTYRKNLLHWIEGWPQEKKQAIFKNRSPEDLLLSTAEQAKAALGSY